MPTYYVEGESRRRVREHADALVRYISVLKSKERNEEMSRVYMDTTIKMAKYLLALLPGPYLISDDVSGCPHLSKEDKYYKLSVEAENASGKRDLYIFYF